MVLDVATALKYQHGRARAGPITLGSYEGYPWDKMRLLYELLHCPKERGSCKDKVQPGAESIFASTAPPSSTTLETRLQLSHTDSHSWWKVYGCIQAKQPKTQHFNKHCNSLSSMIYQKSKPLQNCNRTLVQPNEERRTLRFGKIVFTQLRQPFIYKACMKDRCNPLPCSTCQSEKAAGLHKVIVCNRIIIMAQSIIKIYLEI